MEQTKCKNCGNKIYRTYPQGMWHHADLEPMTDDMYICGEPEPVKSYDAPSIDPYLQDRLAELADQANSIGAKGVWFIRGAKNARLVYEPNESLQFFETPGQVTTNLSLSLALAKAGVIVVMRFPAGDGADPGIELK